MFAPIDMNGRSAPEMQIPLAFDIVAYHDKMLANAGRSLTKGSRVLDFGCGEGRHVYEYRDAGYDAYGFDIRPAPLYRNGGDDRWFRFALTGKPVNVPDFRIRRDEYRIGFDDESFDFVFSNSTMEHVQDPDLAFRETARVVKRGGCAIHTFPSRYRLIEPHIHVPLGAAIQRYSWFLLWAMLGVRNPYQVHMGARECARNNLEYAQQGLRYPRLCRLRRMCESYFARVRVLVGPRAARGLRACPALQRPIGWLYSRIWNVVLLLEK